MKVLILLTVIFSTVFASVLHQARIETIQKEADRFYLDNYFEFIALSETIYTPDSTFNILGTGVFGPRLIHIEYAGLSIPSPFIPVPQIKLFPTRDFTTLEYNGDKYEIEQTLVLFAGLVNNSYAIKAGGIRNRQYFEFEEDSARIKRHISEFAPETVILFAPVFGQLTTPLFCNTVFGICATHLNDTGYTSVEDCINVISALDSKCPDPFSSNTRDCRFIHINNAILNPGVHCPHVASDSPVCVDRCLDEGCGDCDENAHCQIQFDEEHLTLTYSCVCDEGYTGDGEYCMSKSCSANWQCGGGPTTTCLDELCGCADTFTWNNGKCECADDEEMFWSGGVPICIRDGKCLTRYQCLQFHDWNSIKCAQPEYPNHVFPGDFCLCNYGFDNPGYDHECVCSAPKRRVWSPQISGDMCLELFECTENWHCDGDCIMDNNSIGHCE